MAATIDVVDYVVGRTASDPGLPGGARQRVPAVRSVSGELHPRAGDVVSDSRALKSRRFFHHVSRHLSDRPKLFPVAWNILGVRVLRHATFRNLSFDFVGERRWNHAACECRLPSGRATPRSIVRRQLAPRFGFFAHGVGHVMGVDVRRTRAARRPAGSPKAASGLVGEAGVGGVVCRIRAPVRCRSARFHGAAMVHGRLPGASILSTIVARRHRADGDNRAWSFIPASARRGPAGGEHRCPRQPDAVGRHSAAQASISARHAAQRADGRAVGGPFDADRARAALVSRRVEEREAGPDRVCPPVRAPDVQGLEERVARGAHVDDFRPRRPEQRLHDRGRDGVLVDAAGARSAARPVARSRSDGDAAGSTGKPSPTSATWSKKNAGCGSTISRSAG